MSNYTFTRTGIDIEEIHNTVNDLPNRISNANLIPNSDFSTPGSVSAPPDSAPRNYIAGDELFEGFYAVGGLTGVTYVNGVLNGSGQIYTAVYKTQKQKESTAGYVASVAFSDGLPISTGVTLIDSGDFWKVTFDINSVFSVKLELGSTPTIHEVGNIASSGGGSGIIAVQKVYSIGDTQHPAGQTYLEPLDSRGNKYSIAGNTYLTRGAAPQFEGKHYTISSDRTRFELVGGTFRDDEDIFIGFSYFGGAVESSGSASNSGFHSVDDMKSNASVDGKLAETTGYYANSTSGAGRYKLLTLADYRTDIGDPTWTPDGDRDHYIGGGTSEVAVLVADLGIEHASQWGVISNIIGAATENTRKINAINAYLCPYEWDTDVNNVNATYYLKALAGGVCKFEAGFICVDDVILHNPHVTYEGVADCYRIFGKKNVSAGRQLTFINYVGPEQSKYVFDTANYKDAFPGVRITDSTSSFFNSSIDSKKTAYSEGSFLKNLAIVNNGAGRGAVGAFRMVAPMKGGFDGLAVSGFDVGHMISNGFNMSLGSIWVEECYYSKLAFESTNLRHKGQTCYIGNTSKADVPDVVFSRIPNYFGSNFSSDDDNTLPLVHLKQSKGIFEAFCWDTVYDNLTTEFLANPICTYGDGVNPVYLTINNWSEEAAGFTSTIGSYSNVKSVLVTGFNAQVRLHNMHSISDTPLQAMGTGSVMYVTAAKRWVGDSFCPDYMDNAVRGNPFILEEIRTISPKLRRDHNVSIRGLKRDITFYCDDDTGSDLYLGLDSSQRGKLNNIFEGIIQSSDSAGNYVYKPLNQTHEITVRLLGGTSGAVKDHAVGDSSGVSTVGISDSVRMLIVNDGAYLDSAEWTRIVKADDFSNGPVINNCDIKFQGVVLRNTAPTQPTTESNGIFTLSGINTIEMTGVTCQQTDSQDDGCAFTCLNGSFTTISYRDGNMISMPKGVFSIVGGQQAVIDGIITSGVNSGKSSSNPAGLTDRVVS